MSHCLSIVEEEGHRFEEKVEPASYPWWFVRERDEEVEREGVVRSEKSRVARERVEKETSFDVDCCAHFENVESDSQIVVVFDFEIGLGSDFENVFVAFEVGWDFGIEQFVVGKGFEFEVELDMWENDFANFEEFEYDVELEKVGLDNFGFVGFVGFVEGKRENKKAFEKIDFDHEKRKNWHSVPSTLQGKSKE